VNDVHDVLVNMILVNFEIFFELERIIAKRTFPISNVGMSGDVSFERAFLHEILVAKVANVRSGSIVFGSVMSGKRPLMLRLISAIGESAWQINKIVVVVYFPLFVGGRSVVVVVVWRSVTVVVVMSSSFVVVVVSRSFVVVVSSSVMSVRRGWCHVL